MARPWRIQYAGAKYHVTTRGNGRQRVFFGDEDYERFREQLRSALELDEVILYAYGCMPNHTHLLIETPLGNIQRFMQRLNTAYSMYFRYKHNRPGHCLQGRYGAKLVSGGEYLLRLTRYIHLNPVKTARIRAKPAAEQKRSLQEYRWSSYRGYVDGAAAEEMVNYRWMDLTGRKTMNGRQQAYQRYVQEGIGTDDEVLKAAMKAERYAIGDEAFCREVEEELKKARLRKASFVHDVTWPRTAKMDIERIVEVVADGFGVKTLELCAHGRRAGVAKQVAVELCCEYTGNSQRQVGLRFGYTSNGAVGKQRQRLRELMTSDSRLRRKFQAMKQQLG